ncbi:hypothetical protein N480_12545 [Pseudoalteromonas luteoviolacea S2607]|nr:hypothetical protein N480_12545 [Pseudoalteromonas luteoviolacea S2607]
MVFMTNAGSLALILIIVAIYLLFWVGRKQREKLKSHRKNKK